MVLPNAIEWVLPNGFMDSALIVYNRFLLPPAFLVGLGGKSYSRGGLRPITNHESRIGGLPAADQKTMGMKSEPWEWKTMGMSTFQEKPWELVPMDPMETMGIK